MLNSTFQTLYKRAEEESRRREEQERLEAAEREREAKRPRHHDLDIATLTDDLSPEELSNLRSTFRTLLKAPHPKGISGDDAYVFDEEEQEQAEVKDLKTKMRRLKVVARAKVTQDRVYSAAYHPERTKDLIFFGGMYSPVLFSLKTNAPILDKHGQLGIWDARAPVDDAGDDDDDVTPTEDQENGKYYRLQMHWPATSKSSISCVKFDPIDAFSVCPQYIIPESYSYRSRSTLVLTTAQSDRCPWHLACRPKYILQMIHS